MPKSPYQRFQQLASTSTAGNIDEHCQRIKGPKTSFCPGLGKNYFRRERSVKSFSRLCGPPAKLISKVPLKSRGGYFESMMKKLESDRCI